jgi:hypothetical protein
MTWTTFASLGVGPGTTPQLDANFTILSNLVPIPCTATGTNALILTSTAGAATLGPYSNYMQFRFIAPNTTTGAVTANGAGLGVLPVYKDTLNGPVALTGGEIVQNCEVTLQYDSTLNAGGGGFHLQGGGGGAINQTLSVTLLLASAASVSGLFSGNSLTLSGPGSFASLSVSGIGSLATANIGAGNATLSAASVSGIFAGASLVVAGGDGLIRLNSGQFTLATVTLTPFQVNLSTITLAGAAVGDGIHLTPLSSVGLGSLSLRGYVPATGSIVIAAQSMLNASTVTLSSITFRATDFGFVT